jgi:hypothetical protein
MASLNLPAALRPNENDLDRFDIVSLKNKFSLS